MRSNFTTKLCLIALIFSSLSIGAWAQKKPKKNREKDFYYQQNLKSADEIRALDSKIERLFYSFAGEFTNKAQADTAKNPLLSIAQDMVAVPIWPERKGEYWLYFAWFKKGMLDRPLAHAICRFSQISPDTFAFATYGLPKSELEKSYEWAKPKPFAHLKIKDLRTSCVCPIVPIEGGFHILPTICPHNISDAIHFTQIETVLYPDRVHTYTVFFDANQKPLMAHPRPDGLILYRLDKSTPVLPRDFNPARTVKGR